MYSVGERIVYGLHGVFEITDVKEETVLGSRHKYYVLKAVNENSDSLLFVPTDNESLTSLMRYPLEKSEAEKLIEEIPFIEPLPFENDSRARSDKYKKLIESGEHKNLVCVIKSVRENLNRRIAEGKKSYVSDENNLKRAERILYSELSQSLGISEECVGKVVDEAVKKAD